MDVCREGKGDRLYLMGYSFMPAQQFHLEKAGADQGREGWFTLADYREYLRQHFDFGEPAYRRF